MHETHSKTRRETLVAKGGDANSQRRPLLGPLSGPSFWFRSSQSGRGTGLSPDPAPLPLAHLSGPAVRPVSFRFLPVTRRPRPLLLALRPGPTPHASSGSWPCRGAFWLHGRPTHSPVSVPSRFPCVRAPVGPLASPRPRSLRRFPADVVSTGPGAGARQRSSQC